MNRFVLRGRTWTRHAMPASQGINWTEFAGLACPAANSSIAVGSVSAQNQTETSTLLAEHWNGTSWRVERIMLVPHAADTSLSSVSCPTPVNCVTVGSHGIAERAFVERGF